MVTFFYQETGRDTSIVTLVKEDMHPKKRNPERICQVHKYFHFKTHPFLAKLLHIVITVFAKIIFTPCSAKLTLLL